MSLVYQGDVLVNDWYSNNDPSNRHVQQQQKQRRPGLYIGSKVEAKNYNLLTKNWNVTHILNVTPPKRKGIIGGVQNYFEHTTTTSTSANSMSSNNNNCNTSNKFVYLRIPILDSPMDAKELLNYSTKIVTFISSGLNHGSVLVHCQRGISRSTTAVIFYLMRRVGLTLDQSMELIKRRRPQVDPIPAFITILKQFEQQCIYDNVIIINKNTSLDGVLHDTNAIETVISNTGTTEIMASTTSTTNDSGQVFKENNDNDDNDNVKVIATSQKKNDACAATESSILLPNIDSSTKKRPIDTTYTTTTTTNTRTVPQGAGGGDGDDVIRPIFGPTLPSARKVVLGPSLPSTTKVIVGPSLPSSAKAIVGPTLPPKALATKIVKGMNAATDDNLSPSSATTTAAATASATLLPKRSPKYNLN